MILQKCRNSYLFSPACFSGMSSLIHCSLNSTSADYTSTFSCITYCLLSNIKIIIIQKALYYYPTQINRNICIGMPIKHHLLTISVIICGGGYSCTSIQHNVICGPVARFHKCLHAPWSNSLNHCFRWHFTISRSISCNFTSFILGKICHLSDSWRMHIWWSAAKSIRLIKSEFWSELSFLLFTLTARTQVCR